MNQFIRRQASINEAGCVACGSCLKVCPKGAIQIYQGLFARVDSSSCIGCGRCVKICPASVIHLTGRKLSATAAKGSLT